jgi:transcriptional regulator with XRE-family HTH domain
MPTVALVQRATVPRNNPNPIDSYVGNRIRERRTELSISQEELADELGLTVEQIEQVEQGMSRLSAAQLNGLRDILSVDSPIYFFEEAPFYPQPED